MTSLSSFCFFFFQAEDGIRDYKVTGVQTCALPIWFLAVLVGRSSLDGVLVGHDGGSRLQCSRNLHGCLMPFCACVNTSLFYPIQPMSNLLELVGLSQPVKSIL